VLRTAVQPAGVVNAVRRAVAKTAPDVPMDQIATMQQIVYGSVGESRFRTALLAAFAWRWARACFMW